MRLFSPDREAEFIRRPNRFLIIARDGKEELICHCPNPGRLIEFFGFRGYDIPGIRLILEKRSPSAGMAKTGYSVVGLYYRDVVVPFFSSRANQAAEELIIRKIIPGIQEIRPEYTLGSSRFDFLCWDKRGKKHLIEVKACSLVEYGIAMFPDAPSSRALKHLEELAMLAEAGYSCHILFVIVHSNPRSFIPNLHTDPAFAAGLSRWGSSDPRKRRAPVAVHAALLHCDSAGEALLAAEEVPVDLSHGALAEGDSGNYLFLMELGEDRDIETGALGLIHYIRGWYVYCGSARKNLAQRINRHLRRGGKQVHWHIDYVRPYMGVVKALPMLSYQNVECAMAQGLEGLGGRKIPGFGSSDCNCESHLYYFSHSPLGDRGFVDMVLQFRHRFWEDTPTQTVL